MSARPIREARRHLAAPVGVLIGVPLLVLITGLAVAWVDNQRLAEQIQEQAIARMKDSASGIHRASRAMVVSADPILDRLRNVVRRLRSERKREAWDAVFGDLMAGEPTVVWISWYDAAGWFRGMRRDLELGPLMAERGIDGDQRLREWRFDTQGQAQVVRVDDRPGFDLKLRPPWLAATASGRRCWTTGYAFFDSGEPGFSRAEPIYADDGSLLGVLSVDYSLERLGIRMRDAASAIGAEVVLLDELGFVLVDTASLDSSVQHRIIADPRLDIVRAAISAASGVARAVTDGKDKIAFAQNILPAPGLSLHCVLLAPYAPLIARADIGFRTGLGITFAVILASMAVAILYARQLGLARREARQARKVADALGAYVLEHRIGIGGMGEVWRARHRRLACPAALKVIHMRDRSEHDVDLTRARFRREAQVMASLTSLHTVRVFDFGTLENGALYYAMELLDGLDCDSLVTKRGHLSPGNAVHILLQACDALAEAHRLGLVHRDLKPSNILICRSGTKANVTKIVDFGLVIAVEGTTQPRRLTSAGFVVGTVGYCSPEQLRAERLDARSDLYALGCVAHFLITGKVVFPDEDIKEEIRKHLDDPPPFLGDRMPADLAVIIQQCLAKNPDDRPHDAQELRRRLLACSVDPDGDSLSLRPDEKTPTLPATEDVQAEQVVRPRHDRSRIDKDF